MNGFILMTIRIITIVLTLLGVWLSWAYYQVYTYSHELRNPMIWQVRRDSRLFYLGGSFHILPLGNVPIAFVSTLNKVEALYTEAIAECNFDDIYHNKDKFDNTLTAKQAKYIKTLLKRFNVVDTKLEGFTSIGLKKIIWHSFFNFHEFYTAYGVESILLTEARDRGDIRIKALEYDTYCASLKEMLIKDSAYNHIYFTDEYLGWDTAFLERRLAAWRAGNYSRLYELSQASLTKPVKEDLIRRNHLWIDEIENIVNSDNYRTSFIVVGAAHLDGDNGLLNLLNNKGFHLDRLNVNSTSQSQFSVPLSLYKPLRIVSIIFIFSLFFLVLLKLSTFIRKYLFKNKNHNLLR